MKTSIRKLGLSAATNTVGPVVAMLRPRERGLHAPVTMRKFLAGLPEGPKLELGPLDRPRLSGPDVEYFDILDTESLKRYAVEHGRDPNCVPNIHHVSPTGDLRIVKGSYAAIFSSHMAEHHPDLIEHFRIVFDLLEPGGAYFLILPDRRVSFDYFRPESTPMQARARKGAKNASAQAISDLNMIQAHNSQLRHWFGLHGKPITLPEEASRQLSRLAAGDYVDTHNWVFTPASFLELANDLYDKGDIGLKPERVHDTIFPSVDIMAVLRKPLD